MTTFPAIRIEGGFFGPEFLEQLSAGHLPGQKPENFGLDRNRSLTDEIAAVFADSRAQWEVFKRRLERIPPAEQATSLTRDGWMIPFLSLLGYELRFNSRAYERDNLTFAISHRAGDSDESPPVHIVGIRQELGQIAPSGRPRLSPHSLVQEFLNRSEHLWGIVTNGETLRLLRDSTYIRRQAYLEFDLRQIIEEQRFQDFAVLYRLIHRTRLPRSIDDAENCLLERYFKYSVEQGGRVREHLREGVEACLTCLANGFLKHPANQALRQRVQTSSDNSEQLTPQEFYHQLLRLVYRFLFLLVSEERGLISADPVYRDHYGVGRLRRLLDHRSAYTEHDDLWCSLRVLWKVLSDEKLAGLLGASPLNGELFEPLELDEYSISNRDLLDAMWHLSYFKENSTNAQRRVNYSALDVEELGSVYESLLEYHPQIDNSGAIPRFELAYGSERKTTGSYYTPPELVNELIRTALEPVLRERLSRAKTREEKEEAILSIKVLDPAAGSGHFLLAAARRLGKELARIRTGEDEPAPEREREATREVIARCIYGVDRNPLAVELCRVALWLEAHCQGKPLSFLDHHIKCGDSLLGIVNLDILKQGIPDEAFSPVEGDNRIVASALKKCNRNERLYFQTELSGQLAYETWVDFRKIMSELACQQTRLSEIPDDSPELIQQKKQKYTSRLNDPETRKLFEACNLWTAAFLQRLTDEKSPKIITTRAVIDHLAGISFPQAVAEAMALAEHHRFFHWPLEFPEVFEQGGFDVVLGNPPFITGLEISGNLGQKYRVWLKSAFAPFGGTADLCATFFRRAFQLLRLGGSLGMVATNTIREGDTRESGLKVILSQGGNITFARRFIRWPGQAAVEVNLVVLVKKPAGEKIISEAGSRALLDYRPVEFISSRLDDQPEHEPVRLEQNEGKAFQGDIVRGMGFVLEPTEAELLLKRDPRNADCLFPYLNGEDLNSNPEQKPSRYVICFHDWELEQAGQYPDLLKIVEERVKPEREKLMGPGDSRNREYWWQFGAYRAGMRRSISQLRRVLVRSRVSELHACVFVPKGYVYGDATVVFAFDDDYHFALLQSAVHEAWLREQASSLRTDVRYTPTDCFDTFPFPQIEYKERNLNKLLSHSTFAKAAQVGAEYHEHRRRVMLSRRYGLTKIYNLFHDPTCRDEDIVRLRELHVAMDQAVLSCYGWEDIDMRHDFYQNDRGQTRFMPCAEARRELIVRLIRLNEKIARFDY